MNTLVQIEEARAAWQQAIDGMTEAESALENAAADTDPSVLDALNKRFEAAEADAEQRKAQVDKLERIKKARSEVYAATPGENTATSTSTSVATRDGNSPTIRLGSEPLVYDRRGDYSFIWDLANKDQNVNAAERIKRHTVQMAVEQRDLSSSATTGGDFIAPVYLADQWLDVARATRVIANFGTNFGAPKKAPSWTIPRLVSDPGIGFQASDNAALTEVDAVTALTTVNRGVLGGIQDISQQAIDDTTPGLDQMIFTAMAQNYGLQFSSAVINGAGGANLITGILNQSGIIPVVYTDASPTGPELLPFIGQAISKVHRQRFAPPTVIVMTPERFQWLADQNDTTGRPLIVPVGATSGDLVAEAENALGVYQVRSSGLVGYLKGLPVYTDALIPRNLGAGTNEDRIFVMRQEDLMRWEDPTPRAETFRDIGSATLTVRLRVYGYAAFTAAAFPKGIAVISGTGLIAPSGY